MPGNDEREKFAPAEEESAGGTDDVKQQLMSVMTELAKRQEKLEAKELRDSVLEQRKVEAVRFVAHRSEPLNTEELHRFLHEVQHPGQDAKERQLWREWACNVAEIAGAAVIGDVTDQQLREGLQNIMERLMFRGMK